RRVAAGVELVAIEEAVLVAVDADTLPGTGRDAGVGPLLPRHGRLRPQRRVAEERLRDPVAAERPARLPDPAALLAAEVALHDHLALARRGAGDEQEIGRASCRERGKTEEEQTGAK